MHILPDTEHDQTGQSDNTTGPNHDGISRTVGSFCTSNYPTIYGFFGCFWHFGNIPQARGFMKTVTRAWGSPQFPSDCRAEPRDPRRCVGFHHYVCRESTKTDANLLLEESWIHYQRRNVAEMSPRMCMDVNSSMQTHKLPSNSPSALYKRNIMKHFAAGAHQPCTSIQYVWCLALANSTALQLQGTAVSIELAPLASWSGTWIMEHQLPMRICTKRSFLKYVPAKATGNSF